MENKIELEHSITFRWLLLFSLPTIISTIFMNLYTSVDGMFVARLVDTDALSAVNITLPLTYLISAIGMMFGSGGNALIARKIGEGKTQEAREDFSLLIVVALIFSVSLAILCFFGLEPLCRFLGSNDELLHYCREYMIPILFVIPLTVFGTMFQMSYITVGKAKLSLWLSVLGGVLNIILDWLFIAVFHWGIAGAAIATSIGYAVPSLFGLAWFGLNKKQSLYLVKPKWRLSTILQSCANGASEMVSVLAYSVVAVLFNNILMNIAGSDGVASLSIIWYAQGIFGALFRGYIMGTSSAISYNYGKSDRNRLSKLFSIGTKTVGIAALIVTVISYLLGGTVITIFSGENQTVHNIALRGFQIVAISFTLMGYNVFASGWFTALNDGKTSAILSFCRTIIFLVLPVLILPRFLGTDGVWLSMAVGESMSLIMTLYYFRKFKYIWKNTESLEVSQ